MTFYERNRFSRAHLILSETDGERAWVRPLSENPSKGFPSCVAGQSTSQVGLEAAGII